MDKKHLAIAKMNAKERQMKLKEEFKREFEGEKQQWQNTIHTPGKQSLSNEMMT